jgi:hypothetical protein
VRDVNTRTDLVREEVVDDALGEGDEGAPDLDHLLGPQVALLRREKHLVLRHKVVRREAGEEE